jgi:FkbM family methyltransferase
MEREEVRRILLKVLWERLLVQQQGNKKLELSLSSPFLNDFWHFRKRETTVLQVFKRTFQAILRRLGIYHRLRASSLYDLYWRMLDRSIIEDRCKEVAFYHNLLEGRRKSDLIFDVGANQGSKTAIFLRLGARVVAVEPDEANQQILKEMFLRRRFVPKPVHIIGKALGERCAVETMWIDEPGSAKNTLSQKWVQTLRNDDERFGHRLNFKQRKEVETTTLENLIVDHGLPIYIKIDVEGFELNVLRGLRHPIPYLSFEVNLPEFRSEGLQSVELLGALAIRGKFNYTADCRRGLALQEWLDASEFAQILQRCTESSIEVFWKSSEPFRA